MQKWIEINTLTRESQPGKDCGKQSHESFNLYAMAFTPPNYRTLYWAMQQQQQQPLPTSLKPSPILDIEINIINYKF